MNEIYIFGYLNKHLTIIDFNCKNPRKFENFEKTDWMWQYITILVDILKYHTIPDNISRYITILDKILSIYNNIPTELKIMEELPILKLEASIWKRLDNIG